MKTKQLEIKTSGNNTIWLSFYSDNLCILYIFSEMRLLDIFAAFHP